MSDQEPFEVSLELLDAMEIGISFSAVQLADATLSLEALVDDKQSNA